MGFGRISRGLLSPLLLLVIVAAAGVLRPCAADDIVHDDSLAPTQPGCSNSFVLVRSEPMSCLIDTPSESLKKRRGNISRLFFFSYEVALKSHGVSMQATQ